ncbi:MAG TPA: PAS domain S-box protein [Syntrophales bacterium]|nr:PAS domain S-box protein [Syntrophales bacterium]
MKDEKKTRKQLLEELNYLRESEAKCRTLIEESRDAMITTSRQGRLVNFNQAALDLFGYTPDELKALNVRSLYADPKDRRVFMKEIESTGYIRNYPVRLKSKNGRVIDCTMNMAVRRQNGKITGYHGIIQDRSDQKQAEELYSKLAHSSQAGVYVIQDKKFVFVNPYMSEHSGYTKEELIGMDSEHLVHPDDREMVRQNAIRMLKGDRHFPYEHRTITKDGKVIWILENVTAIDYFGRRAILGNSMDVTREREARLRLEEVQEMESSILDAIPHAVIGLENRQIIFANDSVKAVFGWEPEEVIGKKTRIFYRSDEDFEKIGRHFYPVLEHDETYSEEFPCVTRDGDPIVCNVSAARVGGVLREKRIVVVYENITTRKEKEQQLRESEEKYSSVVEQAMYGVVIIQEEVFKFANRAMADITGYSVEELMGMHFLKIFTPEYRKLVAKRYKMRMAGGTVLPLYETKVLCKGGSEKDVEIAFGIISINQQPADMGYVRDITAHKQAQEELDRSFERLQRRLEETVNALSSMTEKRDPYTAGHQQRVTQLARAIAEEMGLPEDKVDGITVAATLHDIGKIYEPAEILSKPDMLTDIEFLMMKVHPQVGYDILKNIDFPWPVDQIVFQHHERVNGTGYPRGLIGEEILLEARILAVADVVEAMVSHRPYRSALGLKPALEEISRNRGILYDPDVVDACLKLFREKKFKFKQHRYTEISLRHVK